MRMKKIIKKIFRILGAAIVLLLVGLILNNRIYYWIYSSKDTKDNQLTETEIADVRDIYKYLGKSGATIYKGFTGEDADLIVYNEQYEFLFCRKERVESDEWDYVGYDNEVSKFMYSREAADSMAFAVKIDDKWVGSINTHAYFNKSVLEQIPVIMPPQLFHADDEYYKAIAIHEMIHAFAGNLDYERVDNDEHYQDVCKNYYGDSTFEALIVNEAKYLEEAVNSEDSDEIRELVTRFLEVRAERRTSCGMTIQDIEMEREFEWLEGTARYAEYISSRDSSSSIAKDLDNISKRVKSYKVDERYYVLGMAEIIVLSKFNDDWQAEIFKEGYSLEESLENLVN